MATSPRSSRGDASHRLARGARRSPWILESVIPQSAELYHLRTQGYGCTRPHFSTQAQGVALWLAPAPLDPPGVTLDPRTPNAETLARRSRGRHGRQPAAPRAKAQHIKHPRTRRNRAGLADADVIVPARRCRVLCHTRTPPRAPQTRAPEHGPAPEPAHADEFACALLEVC